MSHTVLEPRSVTLPACGQPPVEGHDRRRGDRALWSRAAKGDVESIQLEAHGVTTESGAMYRALRGLERDGFAESSWAKSVAGPQRRLYRVTNKGRRELEQLVGAITVKSDVHAAFLDAHDEAPQ